MANTTSRQDLIRNAAKQSADKDQKAISAKPKKRFYKFFGIVGGLIGFVFGVWFVNVAINNHVSNPATFVVGIVFVILVMALAIWACGYHLGAWFSNKFRAFMRHYCCSEDGQRPPH